MATIGAILLFAVAAIFGLGLVRYVAGANRMASYETQMYWPTIVVMIALIIVCVGIGVALI